MKRQHSLSSIPCAFQIPYLPLHALVLNRTTNSHCSMGLQQEEARKTSCNGAVAERTVRYMECRKNHAANVGGYAVDGCREFVASGPEATADALKCAACGCHRSFHRREVQSLPSLSTSSSSSSSSSTSRR